MPIATHGLEGITPWLFDSDTNKYYLEIGGVRMAEIDANGNLRLKGRALGGL